MLRESFSVSGVNQRLYSVPTLDIFLTIHEVRYTLLKKQCINNLQYAAEGGD